MTILDRVIAEVRGRDGPVDLAVVAQRLGIQPSALEGMVSLLERKGLLVLPSGHAYGGACRRMCPGPTSCPFVAGLP